MSIREYITDVFEDNYLLAKIQHLTTIKGIESDLRFLFEKSVFSRTGKLPKTETENRTDLKLPLNQVLIIEMKCYDAVMTPTTQGFIKKDLKSLSEHTNSTATKLFLYFGLYGKTQLPTCKDAFIPAKRLEEIKTEIEKIQEIAETEGIALDGHGYYDKVLPDRILYAAWFYLKDRTVEQTNPVDTG
jgi:hypothetical protein